MKNIKYRIIRFNESSKHIISEKELLNNFQELLDYDFKLKNITKIYTDYQFKVSDAPLVNYLPTYDIEFESDDEKEIDIEHYSLVVNSLKHCLDRVKTIIGNYKIYTVTPHHINIAIQIENSELKEGDFNYVMEDFQDSIKRKMYHIVGRVQIDYELLKNNTTIDGNSIIIDCNDIKISRPQVNRLMHNFKEEFNKPYYGSGIRPNVDFTINFKNNKFVIVYKGKYINIRGERHILKDNTPWNFEREELEQYLK